MIFQRPPICLSLIWTVLLDAATRSNRWTPSFKSFPTVPAVNGISLLWSDRTALHLSLIQSIRKAGKPLLEMWN